MRIIKIICLFSLVFLVACAQIRSLNLPKGIRLLNIDRSGLNAPIWSPDGKQIVASNVIQPMPDLIGFFSGDRHDIVLIDPETGKSSFLLRENGGNFKAETWAPDSKSFAMFLSDGSNGYGIYTFQVDDPKPVYFSESGTLSPDWERIAFVKDSSLFIKDLANGKEEKTKLPENGSWYVSAWSQDMNKLTLVRQTTGADHRIDNIYLYELSTGNFSQFTDDDNFFKGIATFSPDQQLIAFAAFRFTEKDIEHKIFIERLYKSCKWTLPLDDAYNFAWSPDGQEMFLIGYDGVYIADLKTLLGSDFPEGDHCP